MCLILFACGVGPHALVVAANRDESYQRPAAAADFWGDANDLCAGRDLEQGGTWMGVTRGGRFAALTNFRQAGGYRHDARSRGLLVADYLRGDMPPAEYLAAVAAEGERYNGFNLLAGSGAELWYYSNREGEVRRVAPGVHGLSNHLLDTPWPKVERGKRALADCLEAPREQALERLVTTLADRNRPTDTDLPDTGVGLARERELSPMFIQREGYGTRASTVLMIGPGGAATLLERRFGEAGAQLGEVRHDFEIHGV